MDPIKRDMEILRSVVDNTDWQYDTKRFDCSACKEGIPRHINFSSAMATVINNKTGDTFLCLPYTAKNFRQRVLDSADNGVLCENTVDDLICLSKLLQQGKGDYAPFMLGRFFGIEQYCYPCFGKEFLNRMIIDIAQNYTLELITDENSATFILSGTEKFDACDPADIASLSRLLEV